MDELYPRRRRRKKLPVLDELVLTILSQNTSDVNSSAAFESLKDKYPTWDSVAKAKEKDVVNAIRRGGLAGQKAPRIQAILREIHAERGKYDLGHVRRISRRLGIIGEKDNADKATSVYMMHTDPEDRFKFHIDIIIFGREICHARNPECEKCKLRRACLYYKKTPVDHI